MIDSEARKQYRQSIEELQHELEVAQSNNDPARSESVQYELDMLIEELTKATGLGGRSRQMGNRADRARSTVTWRIRSAIKKISVAHPKLGSHLKNSIRTGFFCVYSPELPTRWEL